jgi:hypothetical protein
MPKGINDLERTRAQTELLPGSSASNFAKDAKLYEAPGDFLNLKNQNMRISKIGN